MSCCASPFRGIEYRIGAWNNMETLIKVGIVVFLLAWYWRDKKSGKSNDTAGGYANFNPTRKIGNLSVDDRNNLFKIQGVRWKTFSFNDVIKYELREDGQSITSGGLSIGRAIIGGVINSTGALLGGLTGKRKGKDTTHLMEIVVTMRGENQGLYRINVINKKTKKLSKKYRKRVEEAEEILALFDIKLDSL